jgi:hypothetical protein
VRMYLDGMSFLEEEREAWRPFEALLELTDADLERPVAGAHGWSGRDLMGHLTVWLEWWLAIATELAIGPASPSFDRIRAVSRTWDADGDALNAGYQAEWRDLPMAEVRRRFSATPGELRGYLTVVPESRWLKDAAHVESLLGNTSEHYAEHEADLRAILAAAGR